MDITYTMIGVDGLQYGPIDLEQIKSWAAEGRITGDTKVLRSDTMSWLLAANYAELDLPQTVAQPAPFTSAPAPARPQMMYDPILERRRHYAARWFYWIAALSLVNSVMAVTGQSWRFLIGLGITQFVDALATQIHSGAIIGLAFNAVVAGIFAMFGFFAVKGQSWSFIVGMILFGLDSLLALMFQDWIGLAFHAYVLYRLFTGLQANMELKKLA